jgi:hypothetical protein
LERASAQAGGDVDEEEEGAEGVRLLEDGVTRPEDERYVKTGSSSRVCESWSGSGSRCGGLYLGVKPFMWVWV